MATVIYNAQRDGRSAPISFDGVLLRPGSNDLDESAVVRLLEHPDMGCYINAGIVEFVQEPSPTGALVNLNTASLSELVVLPQIGQATGRKLIKGRPFGSLDDARVTAGLSAEAWAIVEPLVEV